MSPESYNVDVRFGVSAVPEFTASAGTYTNIAGLEGLRSRARANDPKALREVAQQFEGVLLKMMLKSMRDATPGDPFMSGSDAGMFRDLFDHQVSLDLAKSGGTGLADMLVRQLSPLLPATDAEGEATRAPQALAFGALTRAPQSLPDTLKVFPEVSETGRSAVAEFTAASDAARFDTPRDFVRAVWPHARRAAAELGISPEVLVAQSALETGWGKSVIRYPDGTSSFNLFGIKADRGWPGARVSASSLEFEDGIMKTSRSAFRAYESFAASFDDYVDFIGNQPRYRNALGSGADPRRFIRAIHAAGYATDPHYADKVISIMGRAVIKEAIAAEPLKLAEAQPVSTQTTR